MGFGERLREDYPARNNNLRRIPAWVLSGDRPQQPHIATRRALINKYHEKKRAIGREVVQEFSEIREVVQDAYEIREVLQELQEIWDVVHREVAHWEVVLED